MVSNSCFQKKKKSRLYFHSSHKSTTQQLTVITYYTKITKLLKTNHKYNQWRKYRRGGTRGRALPTH